MEKRSPIFLLDIQLVAKILYYVLPEHETVFRSVCKDFNSAVTACIPIICNGVVAEFGYNPTPMTVRIDSTGMEQLYSPSLTALYRLYNFYFHKLITLEEYDRYKNSIGFSDQYLHRYYGDRFMAAVDAPAEYERNESVGPVRLFNFSLAVKVNRRVCYDCPDIIEDLKFLSERLQVTLVKEIEKANFCLEELISSKVPLEVLRCLRSNVHEKYGSWGPLPTDFYVDHMYLRTVIPFFTETERWQPSLFRLLQHCTGRTPHPQYEGLCPEECETVVLAVLSLPKTDSGKIPTLWKNHFSPLVSLQVEFNIAIMNRKRDASPKRK